MNTTQTTTDLWYHGTSDAAGLDVGDYMDPRQGSFESAVWATCDVSHARSFAAAKAALDEDAAPLVFELEILSCAKVDSVQELPHALEEYFEALREAGYDAVRIEKGENGLPELAILTEYAAKTCAIVG